MAKIRLDPLFSGMSGRLGNLVYKTSRGQTYVSRRPRKSTTPPSAAQQANRERFKLASAYAKAAMADPALRAHYEQLARQQDTTPFLAARGDYYQGVDLLGAK